MRISSARTVLLACLGIASAYIAIAQNRSTAEIVGTVTDPTGAPVPAVTVSVRNTATQIAVTVQTNDAGAYDVPLLPPGQYSVTFQHTGFQSIKRDGVKLELDQTARLDARLKIGQSQQVVTVTSETPLLETDNSQEETVFNTALTQNLPLVGRDPSTLAILAPATSTAQQDLGGNDPGRVNVTGNRA